MSLSTVRLLAFVLLLVEFARAKSVLDRSRRALPPAYLSVEGHRNCLGFFQASSSHTELCLPLRQFANCRPEAWNGLRGVLSTEKDVRVSRPPPDSENCFQEFHDEKCLPLEAPPGCTAEAFTILKDNFHGRRCPGLVPTFLLSAKPPVYLSVEGHAQCLSSYQASESHKEKCLPREKPSDCADAAWKELLTVFSGVGCPANEAKPSDGLQAIAPAYLSIEGHKNCLGVHQAEGATFKSLCLPVTKPSAPCEDQAWEKLLTTFTGISCPRKKLSLSVVQPAYLRMDKTVIDTCLQTHKMSSGFPLRCLPKVKPDSCTDQASWDELSKSFVGATCPAVAAGPADQEPEFLSIEGHNFCLSEFNSSSTFAEKCLPKSKPSHEQCTDDVWQKLKDKFTGVGCPETELSISSLVVYVPDYLDCMTLLESNEYCLPQTKPPQCSDDSWRELVQDFKGIRCPAIFYAQLGLGVASIYIDLPEEVTSVEGHSNCLKYKHVIGQPSIRCLPFIMPRDCPFELWMKLPDILGADHCRVIYLEEDGKLQLPPAAIELGAARLCLSTHSKVGPPRECLPIEKPEACPLDAWNIIVEPAAGERCPLDKTSDGKLVLPAAITSVTGYEQCLSENSIPGTRPTQCIPTSRPDDCPEDLYKELALLAGLDYCKKITAVTQYNLDTVSPSYLSIEGYENCLSTHETENGASVRCLPQAQPSGCPSAVWRQILPFHEGIRCALQDEETGEDYTKLPGHQLCIQEQLASPSTMEKCIPAERPLSCYDADIWTTLQKVFPGSVCREERTILPPHFQSISGYEHCLKPHPDDSLKMCLPKEKHFDCPQEAWDSLKISYGEEDCPKPVKKLPSPHTFVAGHEDCLADYHFPGVGDEKCLPLAKKEACSQDAFDALYSLAFSSEQRIRKEERQEEELPFVFPGGRVREPFKPNPAAIRVSYCNTDGDCKSSGISNPICNLFFTQLEDQSGTKWDGVCVFKSCDSKKQCPEIGSLINGLVTGRCKGETNLCEYNQAFIIA